MKVIRVKVEGMMCAGCERRIENLLKTQRGLESVKADHKEGFVQIVLKEEIDFKEIKEKIENLGFRVKEVSKI